MELICPKCRKQGTPHKKEVKNWQKKPYRYWFIAHSEGRANGVGKVRWCYIGKNLPRNLRQPLPVTIPADTATIRGIIAKVRKA